LITAIVFPSGSLDRGPGWDINISGSLFRAWQILGRDIGPMLKGKVI